MHENTFGSRFYTAVEHTASQKEIEPERVLSPAESVLCTAVVPIRIRFMQAAHEGSDCCRYTGQLVVPNRREPERKKLFVD